MKQSAMNKTDKFWLNVKLCAEKASYTRNNVAVWKSRGKVPSDHHFKLLTSAKRLGIELKIEDLNR